MTSFRLSCRFLLVLLLHQLLCSLSRGQQANIVLDQGALVGLKVFPDSSRTAVYAFLGVPYAQPPTGQLRFAPPKPHTGWNWTHQAMSMRPVCPQLSNTVYDETPDGSLARPPPMDEDCLYLNIWVPEVGLRYGNLPVLVIITGEQMAYDWPRNRPSGLDFASEGVVVVGVQYRSNIFGWIGLGTTELPGNYGLLDQRLALEWIQHNIRNFGGDPAAVTLLGHGTSGAPCVLAHLLLQNDSPAHFSRAILMSGGDIERTLASNSSTLAASRLIVQKLGCQFEAPGGRQVARCLRSKSVSDLQKAFESVYDHGNGSSAIHLGPLLGGKNRGLREALRNRTWVQNLPPLMIGICSNEGAFLEDLWLELGREGPAALGAYINNTVLPKVLGRGGVREGERGVIGGRSEALREALGWQYFGDLETGSGVSSVADSRANSGTNFVSNSGANSGYNSIANSGTNSVSNPVAIASRLLHSMQRLLSEFHHEAPFYRLLQHLSTANGSDLVSIYAYVFELSHAMDLRGKVNLFGGASHSSDLPLLLGPSLFQQIARRRFSGEEEKLCRKMRSAVAAFVKSGNPTPGRVFDSWLPYTRDRQFVYALGQSLAKDVASSSLAASSSGEFERNLPQIEQLLERGGGGASAPERSRPNRNDFKNPYQLGPGQTAAVEGRRTKAANYQNNNQQDSGYALHLRRVYGFWQLLLPGGGSGGGIALDGDFNDDGSLSDALSQRIRLLEAAADAQRYRQGFFALLGLVCVLLAVLGLCVYLLRRDPLRPAGFRL